jgi:hypothetical protein
MPKNKRKTLTLRANHNVRSLQDPEILQGMSRSVWASHWAQVQEDNGESFSGMNIYEIAPDTPSWAEKWAEKLADSICHLNGNLTLNDIYLDAQDAGFPRDREAFGLCLAMQAIGSGVHWTDDVSTGPDTPQILVPSFEFYKGAERSEPDVRFVHR